MRKTVTRVTAVALIAVGVWLATIFGLRGPGLGGGGDGSGTTPVDPSADTSEVRTEVGIPPAGSQRIVAGERQMEFLTVVVTEDGYRLQLGEVDPTGGQSATLEEIKRQAAAVPGTREGVKIRLLKSRSAQEGARADLLAALSEVGVKKEEIQERASFVD